MDINSHTPWQKVVGSLIQSPMAENSKSSVTINVCFLNSSILTYKILQNFWNFPVQKLEENKYF